MQPVSLILQFAREDADPGTAPDSTTTESPSPDVPPGLSELKGTWHGMFEATGGGNGDTSAQFDLRGSKWQSGAYCLQELQATGSYSNRMGLTLERLFIQKDDAATLHADGTVFGQDPANLHFALLNFPAELLPTILQVCQAWSTLGAKRDHGRLVNSAWPIACTDSATVNAFHASHGGDHGETEGES